MVTVPSTIAAGESITVPAGRIAVLPNVQVDGTLNVQGDVFIPSGATMTGLVEKVTSTDNAIVRFNGTTGEVQNSGVIIDDSNNVGLGVTPSAWYSLRNVIELPYGTSISSFSADGGETSLIHNATTIDNTTWKYKLSGSNGASRTIQDGTGSIKWQTAPSGTAGSAITWTNAMTLNASGDLLIGTTATTAATNGFFVRDNGTLVSIGHPSGTASGSGYVLFGYNGTQIGSITQNGTTAVAYNTTSDYRLKENVRPADCKKFMDIKFVDYERIDGRHECGVIAHELQEIYPDLVVGEKDATEIRKVEISPAIEEVKDEDGNVITEAVEATYEEQEFPVYQQVNYMGLIARIGTVVQQQAKLIEELRLEVEILKGAK